MPRHERRSEDRVGAPSRVDLEEAIGLAIEEGAVRGVLNRMTVVPPAVVAALEPTDRPYAIQEWMALHISWLSGVRAPVLNVPLVHGLCGALRPPSEWTWLAARAGLRTADFQQHAPSTDADALEHATRAATPRLTPAEYAAYVRTVLVVDGLAIPAGLPDEVEPACGRLGALSQTRLIGVDIDTRGWQFVDASPRPDLRAGGEPFVDVLVDVFGGG